MMRGLAARVLVAVALVGSACAGARATRDYTDRHAFEIAVLLVGAAAAAPP